MEPQKLQIINTTEFYEALRHKPEGLGFDYGWYHWNLLLLT